MATHESAIKRHHQSLKLRSKNQQVKSRLKTLTRRVRTAVEAKDREAAMAHLKEVNSALDKAVSKGVVKRNTASRGVARLARAVHLMTATN